MSREGANGSMLLIISRCFFLKKGRKRPYKRSKRGKKIERGIERARKRVRDRNSEKKDIICREINTQ